MAHRITSRRYTNLGRGLENYFAATHPSQPNYIAMTSGDWKYCGNTDDNVNLNVSNIADLLEAKGLDWKAYNEDFPGKCAPDKSIGKYYRKHNPFMSEQLPPPLPPPLTLTLPPSHPSG